MSPKYRLEERDPRVNRRKRSARAGKRSLANKDHADLELMAAHISQVNAGL